MSKNQFFACSISDVTGDKWICGLPFRKRPAKDSSAVRRSRRGLSTRECLPVIYEKIEDHKLRRRFVSKPLDPRFGRMDSLEQFVEREIAIERYNDLAVENKIFRAKLLHCFDDFREIPAKRLPGFRTNFDGVCRRGIPARGSRPTLAQIASRDRRECGERF